MNSPFSRLFLPGTISYDRETRDFRVTYDGQVIGHVPSYLAGETLIHDYILDLLTDGRIPSDSELASDRAVVARERLAAYHERKRAA